MAFPWVNTKHDRPADVLVFALGIFLKICRFFESEYKVSKIFLEVWK